MDTITAASAPDPQDGMSQADLDSFASSYRADYQSALCATAVALRSAGAFLPGR